MTPTEYAVKCREVVTALRGVGFTRETAERLLPTYFLLPKDQPHADSRPAGYEDRCPDCGYAQNEDYLRAINPPGYDVSTIAKHSYNCPARHVKGDDTTANG
jgi:hypothetical protein